MNFGPMTWEQSIFELQQLKLAFIPIHSLKKVKDAPEHPGLKPIRDRCIEIHYIRIKLNLEQLKPTRLL